MLWHHQVAGQIAWSRGDHFGEIGHTVGESTRPDRKRPVALGKLAALKRRRQGTRVMGFPITKSIAPQTDGQVLILIRAADTFGILVDPETLTGRLLTVPNPEGVGQRLLNASAAVIEGSTITVLHGSGVSSFLLEEPSP